MPQLAPDDERRAMAFANPDDPALTHLAVVGDTYTVLLSGEDTAGRYALIDMLIPAGGGPPPHRHAFEEMFYVVEGAVEVTVRDVTSTARAGETVNIPANAPHVFRNPGEHPMRMLCMVSPAGLERYFAEFGDRVANRNAAPPELSEQERAERMQRAVDSASRYGMEILL